MSKTQQIIDYARQLENVVGYQGSYLKNLTSEFTGKISTQNKIINGLTTDLSRFRENGSSAVSEGEGKSNNARGIKGTDITAQSA